jgi:hypothetical protein
VAHCNRGHSPQVPGAVYIVSIDRSRGWRGCSHGMGLTRLQVADELTNKRVLGCNNYCYWINPFLTRPFSMMHSTWHADMCMCMCIYWVQVNSAMFGFGEHEVGSKWLSWVQVNNNSCCALRSCLLCKLQTRLATARQRGQPPPRPSRHGSGKWQSFNQ